MTTPTHTDADADAAPLQFWNQRVKASRWLIVKTMSLGALAAVLGVLGQGWLEDASPLLPIISQNYGLWQTAYIAALLVIFLLWAAAMLQKMSLLQNSKKGREMQLRVDEQNQRRTQKAMEIRASREAELKERESVASFFKTAPRSTKFDY